MNSSKMDYSMWSGCILDKPNTNMPFKPSLIATEGVLRIRAIVDAEAKSFGPGWLTKDNESNQPLLSAN